MIFDLISTQTNSRWIGQGDERDRTFQHARLRFCWFLHGELSEKDRGVLVSLDSSLLRDPCTYLAFCTATDRRYSMFFVSAACRPGPIGSTMASTRPSDLAFFAFTSLPVKTKSSASGSDSFWTSRCVPPAPGSRPSLISGTPKPVRLSFNAMR